MRTPTHDQQAKDALAVLDKTLSEHGALPVVLIGIVPGTSGPGEPPVCVVSAHKSFEGQLSYLFGYLACLTTDEPPPGADPK